MQDSNPGCLTHSPEFPTSSHLIVSRKWLILAQGFVFPTKLEDQNSLKEDNYYWDFVILRLIRTHIAVFPKGETVRGGWGFISRNMEAVPCCL